MSRRAWGNALTGVGKFKVSPKEERTDAEGTIFDSKLEMKFNPIFGQILPEELVNRQVTFTLMPGHRTTHNGQMVRGIHYRADFVLGPIKDTPEGPVPQPGCMIIDAKGMETPVFKMASKMFQSRFGHPIRAIKTQKALKAALGYFQNIKNMSDFLKQRVADGRPFEIKGYQRSDGSVVDLRVKFLPRDGYLKMAADSLVLAQEIQVSDSCKDGEAWCTAHREVVKSLQAKVEERDSEENVPARVSKETLVPVCDNLSLLDGDSQKVVAFRLQTLGSETRVKSAKAPAKSRDLRSAFKKEINAALPLASYCHRLNLYERKYETLELL